LGKLGQSSSNSDSNNANKSTQPPSSIKRAGFEGKKSGFLNKNKN
jgi:hypothetical protein